MSVPANNTIFNLNSGLDGQAAIDPQFKPYLKNNDLPGIEILNKAAKSKIKPLIDLQSLEKDVHALEMVLNNTRIRMELVKQTLAVYGIILAPIRRLSDDVLAEIFCHCIPTTRNARPFVSEAPMVLTLVCKKWRRTALLTPRLWSTLHIPGIFNYNPIATHPDPSYNPLYNQILLHPIPLPATTLSKLQHLRMTALDQWLHRSGSLPITLSLYVPPEHSTKPDDEPLIKETFGLVAKFSDRLSTLEAIMPDRLLEALRREIGAKPLPSLQRLRALVSPAYYWNDQQGQAPQHDSFPLLPPSLQELSLETNSNGLDRTIRVLPSNLRVLSLHTPMHPFDAEVILRKCYQLERCCFDISDMSRQHPTAHPTDRSPIPLPVLRTFSLRGRISDIQVLCETLETPSVAHLRLYVTQSLRTLGVFSDDSESSAQEDSSSYPPPSTHNLCLFLSQCTSLRTLIVDPTFLPGADLQAMFSCLAHLKELVLETVLNDHRWTGASLLEESFDIGPSPQLSRYKYHLHPLLCQQRVAEDTGLCIARSAEPLLPHLSSFAWNQSSYTPNALLTAFIKARLRQPANTSIIYDQDISSPLRQVASLRDIRIRLLLESDAINVEAEISQYADSLGLKRLNMSSRRMTTSLSAIMVSSAHRTICLLSMM
ncbi:hypothetical protein BJ165DRAFT_1595496 [Panaeolus papilionaceus]|nr:hypothetical protein BJ165DRAFT_1595496 [Panaeolus papilionaceus]